MANRNSISFVKVFLPLFSGMFFAIIVLNNQIAQLDSIEKSEDFALGKLTSVYRATYEGAKIQCGSPNNGGPCLKAYFDSIINENVVLWLGNSQLHAINQIREGDINAVVVTYKHHLRLLFRIGFS